ncbi:hypothetical protein CALCODRAFT_489385 [Calocera cornea HHB12733]|uniref:Uncharacterized protein n=1 Tax=Calocera cornea HHB12733 TaxID=1353952 RepID=A0A165K9Q6_9BASI|nr:hypothetical protein CALCODRAFT_489385 [Calocera cornea HHB12733]
MAQFLYRHASESPQKRPASVSSTDGNDNLLQFSISNNDPFDMCFTHTGSDLVYKATTSTRSCHIVCNSNGRSRDVATIYWQKRDRGTLKVKFQGQSSIYLEDFLRFVQSDGL